VGLNEYNGTRNGAPRHPQKLLNSEPDRSVMLVTLALNKQDFR
jgi:hypothetical protein